MSYGRINNPNSMNGENLFCLTYDTEVVIRVEVEELSWRTPLPLLEEDNNREVMEEINYLE